MKYLLEFAGTILVALLLSFNSFGQFSSLVEGKTRFKGQSEPVVGVAGTPVYSKMKTDIIGILESDYPKVARRFAAFFPLAEKQVWIKEAGFLYVSFLEKDNKVSAVFTTPGIMSYSVAYLKASDIPVDIAAKIKIAYNSYSIFTVKEITVDASRVYQVVLESGCEYVIIHINHDEMEESMRMKKAL